MLKFYKYQATGNDFVVFDGRVREIPQETEFLSKLCDRRFGVGADGVIIIKDHPQRDFEVIYYNPDGSQSLCGNGTRAAIRFAEKLELFSGVYTQFEAYDGRHEAWLCSDGDIKLKMNDVHSVRFLDDGTFIDTGSPHLVRFVDHVESIDVFTEGRKLRYEAPIENGTNVNFIQTLNNHSIKIRTYERGVEQETLSCGTGVTAAAIASSFENVKSPVKIMAEGGELEVSFEKTNDQAYTNILLKGPAEEVFEGYYSID